MFARSAGAIWMSYVRTDLWSKTYAESSFGSVINSGGGGSVGSPLPAAAPEAPAAPLPAAVLAPLPATEEVACESTLALLPPVLALVASLGCAVLLAPPAPPALPRGFELPGGPPHSHPPNRPSVWQRRRPELPLLGQSQLHTSPATQRSTVGCDTGEHAPAAASAATKTALEIKLCTYPESRP